MKFKKITYKISNRVNHKGFDIVSGYAVSDPRISVRICVRYGGCRGYWKVDDYDTGAAIAAIYCSSNGSTRDIAANQAIVKAMDVGADEWARAQHKVIDELVRHGVKLHKN